MSRLKVLCEDHEHNLLPLPPYSPEYNPHWENLGTPKKTPQKGIANLQYFSWGTSVLLLFQATIFVENQSTDYNKYQVKVAKEDMRIASPVVYCDVEPTNIGKKLSLF